MPLPATIFQTVSVRAIAKPYPKGKRGKEKKLAYIFDTFNFIVYFSLQSVQKITE